MCIRDSYWQAVEDCELFSLHRSKFREMLALSVSVSLVQRVAWMRAIPELVREHNRVLRDVRVACEAVLTRASKMLA